MLIVDSAVALTREAARADSAYMLGLETILTMEYSELGIIVRQVEFSRRDLNAKSCYLADFIQANPDHETFHNISHWYIDVINNRIVVNMINFNYEQITIFKREVTDSPMVVFKECTGFSINWAGSHSFRPIDEIWGIDNEMLSEKDSITAVLLNKRADTTSCICPCFILSGY